MQYGRNVSIFIPRIGYKIQYDRFYNAHPHSKTIATGRVLCRGGESVLDTAGQPHNPAAKSPFQGIADLA